MNSPSSNLRKRLVLLRRENFLTQQQVANELDVSRQAYGSWEENRANPSIDIIQKICQFYQITFEELVREVPEQLENRLNYLWRNRQTKKK